MKTKYTILGKFHIQASQIINESSLINGYFSLLMENGKQIPELKLRFMVWFKPAELEPSWRKLLENGEFQGLKNATFPLRSNCRVTLYQDAHHNSVFQPPFEQYGTPNNLWENVYKAIEASQHLIYIAGWSFNPNIVLVRDPETHIPYACGVKIGELMKRKAEEGVAVRIMVWDDETSLRLIKNKGVMNTHDEDAFAYFKHTKVVCRLCPRLHHKFPTLFTHHQKTITVDTKTQNSSNNREIMSFIGGLDICDGRYDTEEHTLFKALKTDEAHDHDFYQTSVAGASIHKGGPREPWHDTHACITGEAAWDILVNFEQRWAKQCNPNLLVPRTTIANMFPQPHFSNIPSQNDWKVQVFRSIDNISATNVSKNFTVELSIHEAYVEAIRHADKFIYIENQYFIGGCHLWEKDRHSGCINLIPESEPVQDILHWTRETMAMMYKMIGEAIEESGELGHPRDYLNFFCLGNREEKREGEFVPPSLPHPFFIWGCFLVDDIYILIGSANINQRSMDGQRDTD